MSRVRVRLVAGTQPELPEGWVRLQPRNCPCCVGRVELQVELVRLIREQKPRGVQIALPEASHIASLRRALGEWPLAEYVVVEPDR